jgi:hypothetical protein
MLAVAQLEVVRDEPAAFDREHEAPRRDFLYPALKD